MRTPLVRSYPVGLPIPLTRIGPGNARHSPRTSPLLITRLPSVPSGLSQRPELGREPCNREPRQSHGVARSSNPFGQSARATLSVMREGQKKKPRGGLKVGRSGAIRPGRRRKEPHDSRGLPPLAIGHQEGLITHGEGATYTRSQDLYECGFPGASFSLSAIRASSGRDLVPIFCMTWLR